MATFLTDLGQALADRPRPGAVQPRDLGLDRGRSRPQSHGRAAITVRQGELVGIGLNDALRRVEKRPLLVRPSGRAAHALRDGPGQPQCRRRGRRDHRGIASRRRPHRPPGAGLAVERAVAIRALVDPTAPSPSSPLMTLDVVGGWDDVAIVPDVKSLIERSGAAQRLLPEPDHPRTCLSPTLSERCARAQRRPLAQDRGGRDADRHDADQDGGDRVDLRREPETRRYRSGSAGSRRARC